ncbi:MAG TPA: metallophosphoesterase [Bacteroidota bacterium]|nr:metallophosphoesterase [Bacteroidota bacterium]
MKILAFTDIHGAVERVEGILKRELDCSAVILGGDVTTNGTIKEAQDAVRRLQRFGKPVFAVAGNMDQPETDAAFEEIGASINARGVMLDQVGIFGVSASPFTPLHTPYEISEEEIALRAHSGWKDIQSARTTIFVPHAPPANTMVDLLTNGNHVGSTAIRKFIEQHHPTVVVCGHIHEARGIDTLGASKIINCGPAGKGYYAVITLGKEVLLEMKG